jgi:hypothetical protein
MLGVKLITSPLETIWAVKAIQAGEQAKVPDSSKFLSVIHNCSCCDTNVKGQEHQPYALLIHAQAWVFYYLGNHATLKIVVRYRFENHPCH